MKELILSLAVILGFSSICYMVFVVITGAPGTKGITREYTSKSGTKRTAKKERSEYIV